MTILFLVLLVMFSTSAQAATYYISPAGSNANAGTSSGVPWLTFSYALDASRASCGDTLLLMDGAYGDGTSTGKISLSGRVCTLGDELTIQAANQRQAKIVDNGTGTAVRIENSAYIILDGLFVRSTDNSGSTSSGLGSPIRILTSNHITVRGGVYANPNRYANSHVTSAVSSQDILLEDNEYYIFHRHAAHSQATERMVVRRNYFNARGGRIAGGYNAAAGLGGADAAFALYPCKDCVFENGIVDGTTAPIYMAGFEGVTNHPPIYTTGNKVLGSVCYKCDYANGINLVARGSGTNGSTQNSTITDVAFVAHGSLSPVVKCSDCINAVIDHVSVFGTSPGKTGIFAQDTTYGGTPSQTSITVTNTQVQGLSGSGFSISGHNTWSGNELHSYNNGTAYNPALPSNWTNALTTNPGVSTCKLWVSTGDAAKGAGTGGSDIGATILYRYVDGVLTTTPLWDPVTGAFPRGANDPDGLNTVAGQSLFDFHVRVNVNTGGCSFPSGYGGAGGSTTVVKGTTAASGVATTATPLVWNHTITAGQDRLLVCVSLYSGTGTVGSVSGIDVSGQAMTLVKRQTSSIAYRAVELWDLASPTDGLRTITATLTGAIGGVLGRSIEFDASSGLNTPASVAPALGATTMSMTALTNTNELLVNCSVASGASTFTAGIDQTPETTLAHGTAGFILAVSTQDGSDGGVLDNSVGATSYMASVGVSLIAGTPDPPSTATLTQSDYLFLYPIGTEAGAGPIAYWLSDTNAKNLPIYSRPNGYARIRAMITGGVATTSPFGVALFCRKNAESYTKAGDTFGSNIFRLYGPGVTPDIPSSLTSTSNRLCSSNCVTGAILRDQASSFTVPALTVGQKIELDSVVVFQAAIGDTVNCRYQNDNGTAFDAYANTPLITFTEDAAGAP